MGWPGWIDELRERYLADEASVFLLHGAIRGAVWRVDGEELDAVGVITKMLAGTRDVLATWDPTAGLVYASMHDRSTLDRHLTTQRTLSGRTSHLRDDKPDDALALIWESLTNPGPRLGFILRDVHRLAPFGSLKNRWRPLPSATPPLSEWGAETSIRAHDGIVVLFCDLSRAREGLLDELQGVAAVEVTLPLPEREAPSADQPTAPDDAPAAALDAARPPPTVADPSLAAALEVALQHAADKRGTGPWPDLLPALESVAALAFERRPDRFGLVSFTADESGVTATGRGGDDILAWFDGDIAARTSAEIALDGLAAGEPRPQAVTALARRFQRLIED